jgi:putative Ca2+/H+ antiporter (TMEM165/GDT1 family)
VVGLAFVVAFLGELPDKSMFASLVLGTRYRSSWVWAVAAAIGVGS